MPQIVLLLKRKPGMTREEFKAHYESSHAQMALKYHGEEMSDYRRNYTRSQFVLGENFGEPIGEPVYDAVTVISFDTEQDLADFLSDKHGAGEEFIADEYNFLDRDKVIGFIAEQEMTQLPGR